MSRPRYCRTFWSYDATVGTAAAAEHPVTNLQTYTRWRRTYRTTDDTPVRIEMQIPSIGPTVAGIYLHHANFDSVLVEACDDGVSWVTVDTYALALDEELNRRKLLIDDPIAHAFIALTPADLVSGAEYVELGAVALCAELVEMTQGPERPGRTIAEAVTRLDYRGGGFELNGEGPPRVALGMSGRWIEERAGADLQALIGTTKNTPLLIDEGDHASHVSIVKRTQDVGWERSFKLREGLGFVFEETM